jgi:RHS repeat-associated protein
VLSTPESVDQRVASASAYEGLSPSEAQTLADSTFPAIGGEAGAGLPGLAEGTVVSEFIGANAARVSLPGGRSGVVEGSGEIATQTAPGRWAGIDMGLEEVGGAFVPRRAGAAARIPRDLSEGVSLPVSGVSLTPLGAGGDSAAGAAPGASDGFAVFWGGASVGSDVDEVAKPAVGGGFELDSLLRSQRSPEVLRFVVGLPEGAVLEQSGGDTGPVFVLEAGARIATILPPYAVDAQGTLVAGVGMSVSGDVVTVSVPHPAGAYAYPLRVDPSVTDELLAGANTNWREAFNGSKFTVSGLLGSGSVTIAGSGSYGLGEAGMLYYPINAHSEARITEYSVEMSTALEGHAAEAAVQLENNTKKVEKEVRFVSNINKSTVGVSGECWKTSNPECPFKSEKGTPENAARLSLRATGPGNGASITALRAFVFLEQEKGPELSFDKSSPTVDGGLTNILYGAGKGWLGPHTGSAFEIHAKDPGLGISFFGIGGGGWGESFPFYEDGECQGVQCDPEFNKGFVYSSKMANGEDSLEAIAYDAANKAYVQIYPQKIDVDGAAPHNIVLTGLGPGGQVGAGEYQLKAEATDGTGTTLSSGMRSIELSIDGRGVGGSTASCSPGPCTAHSPTWTIFGHDYATGRHLVTVTATDNAGNAASEFFTMTVHPASPLPLGPGSFNPQSGELSLTATDVSMPGGLTVGRSYSSLHTTAGVGGALGPQWGLSLGGQESLVKQPDGSMVLTGGGGGQTIFAPNGSGGYISPAGDSNLTLSSTPCEVGKTEFQLKNATANTTTCFSVPSGGSGEVWTPHITQGAAATDTVTYSYETVEVPSGSKNMVTRPVEALAPVPAGVGPCAPEVKVGCRALTFDYATSTTAKGEALAEWGDVEGDLTGVYYTAYDPVSKTMKKPEVAHYLYDKQGRLRAVWDPRVTPEPLKTYYGYDGEGHLTALTPPGQETWAFVYGVIPSNASPNAVVKVTRAPSTEAVWSGAGILNTVAPEVVGPSTVGVRMAVTDGKWTGSPLVYGYQWEDCNSSGGECSAIPGAMNANYTPTSKDTGHRLAAIVTAVNGSGSVSMTALAPAGTPSFSSSFGVFGAGNGQLRESEGGLATDASGDVWVSDTYNERLEEFNSKGEFVRTAGSYGTGAGQMGWTEGLAIDSKGNLWVSDEGNSRVEEFNGEGTFLKMFGWGVANGESKFQTCTSSCHAGLKGSGNGEFSIPEGIAVDSKGNVFVADRGNKRVQEFNSELAWVRNIVQAEEKEGPFDLTVDASNDLWVAYAWDNKIAEFNSEAKLVRTWGTAGSEPGKLSIPYGLAIGSEGDVWVSEYGNNRVQVFTQAGVYLYGFGSKGNGAGQFNYSPQGVAFSGSSVYVLDSGIWWENTGNSRVEKWNMPNTGEGEARPVQPGSAIEYRVPVSGGGAPYAMGSKEVEEGWSQKDIPAEATAVFPADEPQGWPASDYKRATVYYRDGTERTVNVANPGGAISTSEYNEKNDVIRSLTPDDRASALKEGAKSAEVARLLDTQSEYNSEGNELLSTLGPRHTVRLTNGKEVLARNHTVYEYDQGAPSEGGPYNLATKTTQGAKTETEGEQDIRATVTSYSGQNGLGWKLRKPTSVTTDPNGLNLTRTTSYEEATGNVTERGTPAASSTLKGPSFSSSFGVFGVGNGQLREPEGGLATDASGDVWVSDTYNERLEEFNSKGEFVRTAGSYGTGAGQMGWTEGLAIDSKGNLWVSDEGNSRVEEFNGEGTFLKMFGWGVANGESKFQTCTSSCHAGLKGSGNGEFSIPEGIAVDSKGNVFVADRGNKRVQEFNSELAWVRNIVQPEEKEGPFGLAVNASNDLWVAYAWDNRITEFDGEGKIIRTWGTAGSEPGKLSIPYGLAIGPEGNLWVSEYGNNRVQVFTQVGFYQYGFGTKGNGAGQFNYSPQGVAFSGLNAYILDSGIWWENTGNSRVEKWVVPAVGKANVHVTQTIYYTKTANSKYPGCGEHPEWANMPCQVQPAEQPGTSGLPNLSVTTFTYNMYFEPTKTTNTVGTDTRTTTVAYDEAGRPESTETTSTVGTALPKTTDKYSPTTGMLVEQNTSGQSLKSEYNTLGELTSYTDADGNVSTYEYEKENDYRLKKASDGKGTQTYEYDPTTGMVKELVDSAAGTFTASYDAEGNLVSEGYPNAMSANYTINSAGQVTGVQYVKTAHCAKTCPETWYSDSVVPSIHGQWLTQQSELSGQEISHTYAYDGAGRLTQATNSVGGKNCVTHVYAYDEETNRLSLTTRPPGIGGSCTTEGGEIQSYTYDPANRLTDPGTKYDSFGNITELPAADAGGTALLSTYYQDNKTASQTQGTQTIGYQLDPVGRTREIVSTGKITATEIQHYTSPSAGTPSWTGELSTNYTRYITGPGGTLVAIQHNSEKPVLQLANLHGDEIATATDSETVTEPASTIAEPNEYGVPATEAPPKFSWLGAHEMPTALPSGIIMMGARTYIPQLGRFLQTDPQPEGSANAYTYTYGDPINTNDLTGEWTFEPPIWLQEANAGWGAREEQAQLAREQAAREEAERLAAKAGSVRIFVYLA